MLLFFLYSHKYISSFNILVLVRWIMIAREEPFSDVRDSPSSLCVSIGISKVSYPQLCDKILSETVSTTKLQQRLLIRIVVAGKLTLYPALNMLAVVSQNCSLSFYFLCTVMFTLSWHFALMIVHHFVRRVTEEEKKLSSLYSDRARLNKSGCSSFLHFRLKRQRCWDGLLLVSSVNMHVRFHQNWIWLNLIKYKHIYFAPVSFHWNKDISLRNNAILNAGVVGR